MDDTELQIARRHAKVDFGLFSVEAEARKTDPKTSHQAAKRNSPKRATLTMQLLTAYEDGSAYTDEEAVRIAGMTTHPCPWRRATDLRKLGYLEVTGDTKRTSNGMQAQTCRITDAGRHALALAMPMRGQPQPVRLGRAEI